MLHVLHFISHFIYVRFRNFIHCKCKNTHGKPRQFLSPSGVCVVLVYFNKIGAPALSPCVSCLFTFGIEVARFIRLVLSHVYLFAFAAHDVWSCKLVLHDGQLQAKCIHKILLNLELNNQHTNTVYISQTTILWWIKISIQFPIWFFLSFYKCFVNGVGTTFKLCCLTEFGRQRTFYLRTKSKMESSRLHLKNCIQYTILVLAVLLGFVANIGDARSQSELCRCANSVHRWFGSAIHLKVGKVLSVP